MARIWVPAVTVLLTAALVLATPLSAAASTDRDNPGLVDPTTGIWDLYEGRHLITWFSYGNPGDYPFMGDWNCNGIDTPGLYRQSDGYV